MKASTRLRENEKVVRSGYILEEDEMFEPKSHNANLEIKTIANSRDSTHVFASFKINIVDFIAPKGSKSLKDASPMKTTSPLGPTNKDASLMIAISSCGLIDKAKKILDDFPNPSCVRDEASIKAKVSCQDCGYLMEKVTNLKKEMENIYGMFTDLDDRFSTWPTFLLKLCT